MYMGTHVDECMETAQLINRHFFQQNELSWNADITYFLKVIEKWKPYTPFSSF